MRKIFMLLGIAAAIYGARKLFAGNKEDELERAYTPPSDDATGYVPQPQP